jgi:hypothetical protein
MTKKNLLHLKLKVLKKNLVHLKLKVLRRSLVHLKLKVFKKSQIHLNMKKNLIMIMVPKILMTTLKGIWKIVIQTMEEFDLHQKMTHILLMKYKEKQILKLEILYLSLNMI